MNYPADHRAPWGLCKCKQPLPRANSTRCRDCANRYLREWHRNRETPEHRAERLAKQRAWRLTPRGQQLTATRYDREKPEVRERRLGAQRRREKLTRPWAAKYRRKQS